MPLSAHRHSLVLAGRWTLSQWKGSGSPGNLQGVPLLSSGKLYRSVDAADNGDQLLTSLLKSTHLRIGLQCYKELSPGVQPLPSTLGFAKASGVTHRVALPFDLAPAAFGAPLRDPGDTEIGPERFDVGRGAQHSASTFNCNALPWLHEIEALRIRAKAPLGQIVLPRQRPKKQKILEHPSLRRPGRLKGYFDLATRSCYFMQRD